MNLGFLMVVVTMLEGGQMSAAFVNTQTLMECEQRAAAVRGILEKGNVDIKAMACRSSDAQFEPFSHGSADDATLYRYSISIDDSTVRIEPVAACAAASPQTGQYCASSNQNLLSQKQ